MHNKNNTFKEIKVHIYQVDIHSIFVNDTSLT
jgi:hypothetical protein